MLQDEYTQEELKEVLDDNGVKYHPTNYLAYVKKDDYHGTIIQYVARDKGEGESTFIDIEWVEQ